MKKQGLTPFEARAFDFTIAVSLPHRHGFADLGVSMATTRILYWRECTAITTLKVGLRGLKCS